MIQKYYILTPNQKNELYVVTILFFLLFLLFRPILLELPFNGPTIGNLTILFFIWYGLTKIMTNALIITNDKMNASKL
jgi:hypothetical protein